MADEIVVEVVKPDDIVAARQAGHQLARGLGFSLTDVTMIATAISEIARNITSYAGSGQIHVTVQNRGVQLGSVEKAYIRYRWLPLLRRDPQTPILVKADSTVPTTSSRAPSSRGAG